MTQRLDNSSSQIIVRKAYFHLLPIQIFSIIVSAVNTLAGNIITGHFLGYEAMAAVGFFLPVAYAISVPKILTYGAQILSGRMIGRGERDNVIHLFSATLGLLGAVTRWQT